MNILITILIIIGSIIALFLILALLVKKEFSVSVNTTINKSQSEVFNYLRMLKNQEYYSVWVMKDPNIRLVYTGTDGTVGAISSWESNDKNVGVGAQEIIKVNEDNSMNVEVRFKKPFEGTSYATYTVATDGSQTKTAMTLAGKSKFPMNVMNLFMPKLLGRDMQQNLDNMKVILEK